MKSILLALGFSQGELTCSICVIKPNQNQNNNFKNKLCSLQKGLRVFSRLEEGISWSENDTDYAYQDCYL